ncbi:hypothetical protein V8F06_009912 [Rhypophila decipiens]
MEVIETSEAFAQHKGDLVFDHTKIILWRKEDNQYFYSRTQKRIRSPSEVNVNELEFNEIPTNDIWPIFNPKFTQAPTTLTPNTYIKRPSLLNYGDTPASCKLSDQISTEVEVCELLMKNPHLNIAQYLGCIVEGDRITGLCFARYDMTLSEKQRRRIAFDRDGCLERIKDGVRHLHELGLVHNDLNPRNIMMDGGGNPVIIDFDSCKREGHELGLKGGTDGWAMEGITHARYENDFYGISKIREFLMNM